jgi:hypothetical protein
MTMLLEKDAKFVWSEDCEEAFCTLKKLLTIAPVLAQPDIEKPFDVYYDVSGMGIGRWLELIKNYGLEIHYHPGIASVMATH